MLVVLDHHQAALGHRAAAEPHAHRQALAARFAGVAADHLHQLEHRGVVGHDQPHAGHLVAEQLAGALADRLEHVAAARAVGDRALDARQALEQLLALLERLEQPLVELGLDLGLVALAAFLGGKPEQPQRQTEHARHAAAEMQLVDGEVAAAAARQHEAGRGLVLDGDPERRALAQAGCQQRVGAALAHVHQRALERGVAGEADRHVDLAVSQQRRHLGVERLGRALHGEPAGRALVAGGGDRGQKAGQLLGRPVGRSQAGRRWGGRGVRHGDESS